MAWGRRCRASASSKYRSARGSQLFPKLRLSLVKGTFSQAKQYCGMFLQFSLAHKPKSPNYAETAAALGKPQLPARLDARLMVWVCVP